MGLNLDLTADQILAAEAAGCSFHPVPPGQLPRYAMQRKVFHIGNMPVLATCGGGLFETAGTLERLVQEGRKRLGAMAAPAAAAEPPGEPVAGRPGAPPIAVAAEAPGPASEAEEARPEPRRGAMAAPAAAAEPPGEPVAGRPGVPPIAVAAAAPGPASEAEEARPEPGPVAMAAPAAEAAEPGPRGGAGLAPPHGKRPHWLTAGAERRGRAAQHWSQRRR